MARAPALFQNVFELARSPPPSATFQRLFDLSLGHPRCIATPGLVQKYGVQKDNQQSVLCITNNVTLESTWFNEARTLKPQTFVAPAADAAALDPTGGGGAACDFCNWQEMTAEDTFGRVEGPHAVSCSNLFKYVAPAQGVVMFKHHDPLSFDLPQLGDLLDVSHRWFQQAAAATAVEASSSSSSSSGGSEGGPRPAPGLLHPLFVWNCLPRAGASQFHGHAQVMLAGRQFPALQRDAESVACYHLLHPGESYWQDVLEAHEAVGLLRSHAGAGGDAAFCYPSLTPWKDCEIVVQGQHVGSPAFQLLLFAALRTLIDELGVRTLNAAISGIGLQQYTPPAGTTAVTTTITTSGNGISGNGGGSGGSGFYAAAAHPPPPVVARVVSRGKLSNQASDFGGLEVFGSASIGHTDPFRVATALDAVLQRVQQT